MTRTRAVLGGSIGNLIEWYDFYCYSFFSLYFAKAFFPNASPTGQLLSAAAIFAGAFFFRPVGGYLMGVYADRRGRRAALVLGVLMMSAGSLIVAVCPTYAVAGVAAPIILFAARVLQGVSLGGEYGASATYLSEIGSARHRGFVGSFQYVSLVGGQLLASLTLLLMQNVLTKDALEAWGWRIPFVIGAALALVAFWLRRGIPETAAFARSGRTSTPLRDLWAHRREVALVIGLTMGGTAAFYTYTIYLPKLLTNSVGLSREQVAAISAGSLFLFACLQPVMGALSDRVGRRAPLIAFGVAGTLGTVPILAAIGRTHGDPWAAFWLSMIGLLILSGYTSINAVVKAELFPASIRAIGVALPYAIAVSLFGGTAEPIALGLRNAGYEAWFAVYITALIAGSLAVYVLMRDTRRTSRIEVASAERA